MIAIRASTEGFNLNSCVALFAEHYVTDAGVKRENKACYFIDRFVIRYQNITKHILETCVDEASLPRVRAATLDTILAACSVWLHLHEYSHRLGNMPLPEYLDFKTPRNAAAIEELRVDVLTVLLCYDLAEKGYNPARAYADIIFTERCFRYAVQYDINENYDARGSAILFNYLLQSGAIRTGADDRVAIDHGRLIPALRQIIENIDDLEMTLKDQDRIANSEAKKALVRRYLKWNETGKRYEKHDLMANIGASLNSVDLNFSYPT